MSRERGREGKKQSIEYSLSFCSMEDFSLSLSFEKRSKSVHIKGMLTHLISSINIHQVINQSSSCTWYLSSHRESTEKKLLDDDTHTHGSCQFDFDALTHRWIDSCTRRHTQVPCHCSSQTEHDKFSFNKYDYSTHTHTHIDIVNQGLISFFFAR